MLLNQNFLKLMCKEGHTNLSSWFKQTRSDIPFSYVAWFGIGIACIVLWMVLWVPHNDKNLMKNYGKTKTSEVAK